MRLNGIVGAEIPYYKMMNKAMPGPAKDTKRKPKNGRLRGCLVTMFYNRDVCRQGEEYLQNQRYPVFRTHIRRTEKADEVTFTTQSLMQYSPRSGAARDYKTFVKEYLEG